MEKNPDMRAVALDTLIDMDRNKKLSHVAIGETLMRYQFIPKQDRAFYTNLCQGVMERRIYLDYVLDSFSKTPMRKCKPLIRNLLRMSVYQILFMNVPDAAACNEAAAIAKKRGFRTLTGFVNGVLRNIARNKAHIMLPDPEKQYEQYLSIRYSMPEWIVELLLEQYSKEEAEGMLASFQEVRPVSIRTNLSVISPETLKKQLEEENITVKEGNYLPYAFSIYDYNYLGKIRAFREGLFAVQDESSMLCVEMADIHEGDLIMDLCAAPGGKTFHAADRAGQKSRIISRDLTEYKTSLIRENQERMKYEQVEIEEWDATVLDEEYIGKADVVLADLPCSGLGIMGRKNDIKYHVTKEQLEELSQLQREILVNAVQYVKPGGQMIYSTCTMNQGENLSNVKWIEEHTNLELVSIEDRLPEPLKGRSGEKGYLQLIPGKDTCDGFFFAKFVNRGQENE